MDEWKEVWDWAREVWGDNSDYSLNTFFRRVASEIAEREQWEELGSSDVWHASYDVVKSIKKSGKVTTRDELRKTVCDYQGVNYY